MLSPLIPGITATIENLVRLRDHLRSRGVKTVQLLPYNPLWCSKLEALGHGSSYDHGEWLSAREKARIRGIFEGFDTHLL